MTSVQCQLTSVDAVRRQRCVAVTWLRHGKGEPILVIDCGLDLKGKLKEWGFLLAIEGPRG